MGTANRRRVIALATFVSFTAWAGLASAGPDSVAVADAVRSLDGDHDSAIAAVYVLQSGGQRAAEQIRDAWPTLSSLGQKRALQALARLAKERPAAVEALVEAARSDEAEVRDAALATLRRSGPQGYAGLIALLPDPSVGDRAASSLARAAPDVAIDPLLEAMASTGGEDRRGLRSALGTAVRNSGKGARHRLEGWVADEPPPAAVASASMALTQLDEYHPVVASFIEYAVVSSPDFETSWRLLQSAGAAGPSETVDDWVRGHLEGPEEWMLRQSAVDAITARGRREDARVSLNDSYPRVRSHAALALSGDPETLVARATLARKDTWPMVRAGAVSSLRTEADAIPVIVAAVDDSMSVVRTAAIEVLVASSHDQGWERVHRRLRASKEWPQVTAAAIDYVVVHCQTDAVDALLRVVMRAAPSNALTDDLNNAARAIEALRALGTPESEAALSHLRNTDQVPPTLKMALEQPPPEDGGCGSSGR